MDDRKEVSASPTPDIKLVNGVLHQVFIVTYDDNTSIPELREVPSETTE